jgi:hypothetical protein
MDIHNQFSVTRSQGRTRTFNQPLNRRLLCHLSYLGLAGAFAYPTKTPYLVFVSHCFTNSFTVTGIHTWYVTDV